jgi:hypothetical protein
VFDGSLAAARLQTPGQIERGHGLVVGLLTDETGNCGLELPTNCFGSGIRHSNSMTYPSALASGLQNDRVSTAWCRQTSQSQ